MPQPDASSARLSAAMDLLLKLQVEDEQPMAAILTDDQRPRVRTLLDNYYRETPPSGTVATYRSDDDLLRQVTRLCTEIDQRNKQVSFLSEDLQRSLRVFLASVPNVPKPLTRPTKRAIIATVIAAAVIVVGAGMAGVVHYVNSNPSGPVAANQAPPPVQPEPLTHTNLEQTRQLFGPWRTIAPTDQSPDSAQPAILMLNQDGSELASTKWAVPFDLASWQQQPSPYISELSVAGTYVQLTSSTQESFIVHVDQAFIFEQAPGQVYLVDNAGHVWFANLAQATALRHAL